MLGGNLGWRRELQARCGVSFSTRWADSLVWAGLLLAVSSADSLQARIHSNWVVIGIHRGLNLWLAEIIGSLLSTLGKKCYFWVWFCFPLFFFLKLRPISNRYFEMKMHSIFVAATLKCNKSVLSSQSFFSLWLCHNCHSDWWFQLWSEYLLAMLRNWSNRLACSYLLGWLSLRAISSCVLLLIGQGGCDYIAVWHLTACLCWLVSSCNSIC